MIEVLGERYQLQDPIGKGGMATIYRGHDMRMDREVAVKVLRDVYSTDPKFVNRFQLEAKAASALQHPNIVQVYDYGQTEGNYFIVMELIDGADLRRYLRSRGPLAIDRAIIIAHDVALGLGAAHRRSIVHRDVKPQNVLVGRDGSIKLTDFGIASVYKDINAERLTTTGMTLGTVQYYAPEQAQGEIVSPAADVYALGIVMYEMLTGHPPFDGDTPVAVAMQHIQDVPRPPSQLNPNIPPALEEIILRCLEKVPEMRYRDGSVLARALEMLGETELAEGFPPSSPGSVTPGFVQTLQSGGATYSPNLIPPRPSVPRRPLNSSPNNMPPVPPIPLAPTPVPANQQRQNNNIVEQSPAVYNAMAPAPYNAPVQLQPPPYNNLAESGSTRPFQRDTLRRPGAQDTRDSRFASIVTGLILLATLLLLGFSVYLAAVLGFITIPGITQSSPTATVGSQLLSVPDLRCLTLQQAQSKAGSLFMVAVQPQGSQSGLIDGQAPQAGTFASKDSTITVALVPVAQAKCNTPSATATGGITIPKELVGNTLLGAEQILMNLGIPLNHIKVVSAGTDSNQSANIVTGVNPPVGASISASQLATQIVTLSVVNLNTVTPTPTPTVKPTPSPTPSPTVSPTPSPTVSPTPSPTVSPTPSPTVSPTPSPTVGPTPDPIPPG